MSRNLTDILRAHEGEDRPTALAVLKEAMDERGEITDDDRRRAAALSGLPEAAVYGISSFYDDLVQPRGERHVAVCTGTACWAADFGAHVDAVCDGLGLGLGERSEDGSLSLAQTVCLGFCHSAGSVREGDVVDAGEGVVERALAGELRQAEEPESRSVLDEPVLLQRGTFDGLRHARESLAPEELLATGQGRQRARPRRRRLPGRHQVGVRRARGRPRARDRGQRRRGRPRLLHRQAADGAQPRAAAGGHGAGRARGRRRPGPHPGPLRVPALHAHPARGGRALPGELGDFTIEVVEGAGSYVVGEETALLASLQGFRGTVSARPPFPAERGWHGKPTVVHNVETLCNIPFIALHGAEAYAQLSPDATPGTKLVCLNDRFERPGMYEVRFGTPMAEICEQLGGGLRDGHSIKAIQIGGPLGGILPGWKLDTPFDFDELAAEGCMVGHGGILAFDERTDMRALASHLLEFGAHESCGKCFPCRIGLQRAFEMVERPGDLDRDRLEALLETLELGSLCAHGGGMPAPIRSLLAHWPEELRVAPGPEPTDDPYNRRPEERREDDPGGRGA